MSWDQSSYVDERDFRFSNTNTPQRGSGIENNAGEEHMMNVSAAPSPYPGGQYPYGAYPPIEGQTNEPAPYPFPEIGGHHQWPSQHAALPPRQLNEEETEEVDISPPPTLKRTTHNFELSLSHSTTSPSSGSSGASKKLQLSHESSSPEQEAVPEHRDASEQKSAERIQGATIPHPSEFAFAVPRGNAAPSPDVAYAASTMYTFDDGALAHSNAGQNSSPIKKLPVQAARRPPAKKSSKAKAKRPGRRRAAKKRKTEPVASGQSTSEEKPHFEPTAEELAECIRPRAQQALRTWYQRLGELAEYKRVQ